MSATMARQGDRVQLEQSNMGLALNMAKMAKGGFSLAAIQETHYLIKRPHAEVQEEKKSGVQFTGHQMVNAARERHITTVHQNHTDWFLPCNHVTAKHPQTCLRCKWTGAFQADRHRQSTPEPTTSLPRTPLLPGMLPGSSSPNAGPQRSQILNLSARYVYSHTSVPCTEYFSSEAYAQDSQHDTDFDPDILADEGTSTG